ncbi:conserved exported hypothetical protein [Burkholderia sp. 8Y]|uniref:hypothetical protein n=1 Tax=Burkholderia sp. 8Y TaxID=2653133 RepID=UPI0012F3BCD2|nr:hypothetical protein [Burkholderia sp. 8Y]VXC90987.1 conserved exported hypothetical protein [Burkholderia sp. 8Y]
MKLKAANVVLSFILASTTAFVAPLSHAQGSGATATDSTQAAPTTKAQRKAARKEARAKKNAELKKLEDAGYNPARANDTDYPQDVQRAQKKAGVGAGASQ